MTTAEFAFHPRVERDDDFAASLAELLTRARHDHRAMNELIRACGPVIEAVCRRYGTRAADVDDVAQEVRIALYKNVDRIEKPEALRGWLRSVANHAAMASSKRTSRLVPTEDLPDVAATARPAEPDEEVISAMSRAEERRSLTEALDRLREKDRVLVGLLSASERPDYRAISAAMGRPVGSLGPTRQRVLRRLRRDPAIVQLAGAR
jgi:RNA polymerase sigma factor (sigma-70 family)